MVHTKAQLLKALAHPNRLRIINQLHEEQRCNCDLAELLHLEQSNLTRHLSVLIQAGIVETRKDGVKTFYRVEDDEIVKILQLVEKIAVKKIERQLSMLNK